MEYTEEDTFKRLKGLTYSECLEMYTEHYLQFVNSHPGTTIANAWKYVDTKLRPYGWCCSDTELYGLRLGGVIE